MNKVDVAVVGAGLAGLHCARSLAAKGVRVALIDRKASVTEAIQTTGIVVRKTWEDFRIPSDQLGAGIREVTLYSPARRTLHLTAGRDEFRLARMPWLLLDLLEQCALAGVRWMPSTRFVSADEDAITIERRGRRAARSALLSRSTARARLHRLVRR